MMSVKVEDVFGVRTQPVESYVTRESVDDEFLRSIESTNQVVVYGSSKQGKTALVKKYLPYDDNIVVQVTPKMSLEDLYRSVLRQAGVKIKRSKSETQDREIGASVGTKFKAVIPLFGSGEGSASGEAKSGASKEETYEEIPFNLSLPQDISELLEEVGCKRSIIVENFHYLDEDLQSQFAFDLRTFQDLGLQFVILGVWKERNRMAQFNGDLLDRVDEIPVEPWRREDFQRVASKGADVLNIRFDDEIVQKCCDAAFGSIGVFQELLKITCLEEQVDEHDQEGPAYIVEDEESFATALDKKAQAYSARHTRALEVIAAPYTTTRTSDGLVPLFLPYYLVRVILNMGYDGMKGGIARKTLHESIRECHHRGDDVRASDMSNLLYSLDHRQAKKGISPPIIDFDRNSNRLQVVDSTFNFFMKNSDLQAVLDRIPNPLDEVQ